MVNKPKIKNTKKAVKAKSVPLEEIVSLDDACEAVMANAITTIDFLHRIVYCRKSCSNQKD